MSKAKKNAGMTLTEVIIAVALLLIITGPILGVYVFSARANAILHRNTTASYTAQLLMEEYVGLTKTELESKPTISTYNGFEIGVAKEEIDIGTGLSSGLWKIIIDVYEIDTRKHLCTYENYINVNEGGVPS